MKKALIFGGIALVFMLLVGRLLMVERSNVIDEQEWFARELRYEFSAVVDSIRMFNAAAGNLRCRLIAGDPEIHREDSLKRFFRKHDKMYLIFHRSADSIIFILPYANQVSKGDSVWVSSRENTIQIFRKGKEVVTESLSSSLTAYQKPPFVP